MSCTESLCWGLNAYIGAPSTLHGTWAPFDGLAEHDSGNHGLPYRQYAKDVEMGGIIDDWMSAGKEVISETQDASTATLADDEEICFGMVFHLDRIP